MKNLFKLSSLFFVAILFVAGCKKDETKLYYQGGTTPELSATPAADTVSYLNADKTVLTLHWTNPNYQFTTGVSSLDVTYNLQIDTVGSNFTNPSKKVITVSKDLSYSFTASDLNDIMLNQLSLENSMQHNLEFRVISNLTNNSARLISNSVQYAATPFVIPPKIDPPASGTLYITGSATDADWQCGCGDAPPANQTFTRVSPTQFELTTHLKAGGSFLFIPRYGTWNAIAPDPEKYGGTGANNTNNVNGDDLKRSGGDLLAPSVDGTYKIVVDFQRGKYTLTKQ
jgi:hypothetical protein